MFEKIKETAINHWIDKIIAREKAIKAARVALGEVRDWARTGAAELDGDCCICFDEDHVTGCPTIAVDYALELFKEFDEL